MYPALSIHISFVRDIFPLVIWYDDNEFMNDIALITFGIFVT